MTWYIMGKSISRKEAKDILNCMREIIDRYGFVTLADFYDLTDKRSCYLDLKKGWYSLSKARVSLVRRHGNYRMKLPALEEIT